MTSYPHTAPVSIWTDNTEGELVADAVFDVTEEREPLEPYTWGQSRGYATTTTVELVSYRIGGWQGDRAALVAMIGEDRVAQAEEAVRDAIAYERGAA